MKKNTYLLITILSLLSCSKENKNKENLFVQKDGKPRAIFNIVHMDKCLQLSSNGSKTNWCIPEHMPTTCEKATWQQLSHLKDFKKLKECPSQGNRIKVFLRSIEAKVIRVAEFIHR